VTLAARILFAFSSNSCYLEIGCGATAVTAAKHTGHSSQLESVAEMVSPAASVSEHIDTGGQQRRLVAI